MDVFILHSQFIEKMVFLLVGILVHFFFPFLVLVKIFLTIYVAMMIYPYFVAQNIQNKMIGSIFGMLISLYW